MARGWESKSVEQQQEERASQRDLKRAAISPAEQERGRKRAGLLLSRQHLNQQLNSASNPRHRQMLQVAISELNRQLASIEQLTNPPKPK